MSKSCAATGCEECVGVDSRDNLRTCGHDSELCCECMNKINSDGEDDE